MSEFFRHLWRLRFVLLLVFVVWLVCAAIYDAIHQYPTYVAGFCAIGFLLIALLVASGSHQDKKRGWRVRCVVSGKWAYEEFREGKWDGIIFEVVTDFREPGQILDIRNVERWNVFLAWARERRDEIITRVKSRLHAPTYFLEER
jgi:hypothetical protein